MEKESCTHKPWMCKKNTKQEKRKGKNWAAFLKHVSKLNGFPLMADYPDN